MSKISDPDANVPQAALVVPYQAIEFGLDTRAVTLIRLVAAAPMYPSIPDAPAIKTIFAGVAGMPVDAA